MGMRFKEIVGAQIVKSMITIYDMIDINGDGGLSIDEVVKFNVFLDCHANLPTVYSDTVLLFRLADEDGDCEISNLVWLQGWCQSVVRVGNANHLKAFIQQFEQREIQHSQMEMACQFSVKLLAKVLRWA